jgi:hypothetical protein
MVAPGSEFGRQLQQNRLGGLDKAALPGELNSSVAPVPSTGDLGGLSPTAFAEPAALQDGRENNAIKAKENSLIEMKTPSIDIQTYGPPTVGVHKRAQYKLVVTNQTSHDAEHLTVSVELPQWVNIDNVSTTIGRREAGTQQRSQRVNWVIDRLSAGSAQTMTVDATPTKAEHFDFVVDWTIQTHSSGSKITVTEPRLEMNIAGPNEILYGETAMYKVTVRNPGTGLAENIVVMLPEALGGERQSIGDIAPGQDKTFDVELLARAAGELNLTTIASGAGELQTSASRNIIVRRPELDIAIIGPPLKYAGTVGQYEIRITNKGDAIARDVTAALALPAGVQFIEGIEGVEANNNIIGWQIGTLDVGDSRTYKISCQLNSEGNTKIELGARGSSDIAGIAQCVTKVESVADMVLAVEDPKGPLPTGQKQTYKIRVKNRGTRAARQLNLVMQYSEGIEPTTAQGLTHQVVPGQVIFTPIASVEAGEEMTVEVIAQALTAGTHRFRAQLTTDDGEVYEVAEGTTRFYGDNIPPSRSSELPGNDSQFKR